MTKPKISNIRKTFVMDSDLDKRVHQIVGHAIMKKNKSVSYSHVLCEIIRVGLRHVTEDKL